MKLNFKSRGYITYDGARKRLNDAFADYRSTTYQEFIIAQYNGEGMLRYFPAIAVTTHVVMKAEFVKHCERNGINIVGPALTS